MITEHCLLLAAYRLLITWRGTLCKSAPVRRLLITWRGTLCKSAPVRLHGEARFAKARQFGTRQL